MKLTTKAMVACFAMVASVAFAEATEEHAVARQALMKTIGGNVKILGDMAGGKADYDAAAAEAAKAAIVAAAADISVKFETSSTDPDSKAKPEIWTNWDDFVAKGQGLADAINALDASSLDGVKAGMGAVGGACKDCHSTYRAS